MYHERFRGTHYEAGFRWGRGLREHGKYLTDQVPFPVSKERIRYAEKCRAAYEKWYPEVLEEIRGIADGQGAEAGRLEAVLLGMYCILPQNRCSCLAFRQGKHVILARNSDFLTEMEKWNQNGIYRLDGGYHFQGNTTAFVEMEEPVAFAVDVLRGRYGFLCQYERRTGKDTVWSVVYDVGEGKVWRCEGNPSRKSFKEDGRFGF